MHESLRHTTLMGERLEFPKPVGLIAPFLTMVEQAAADPKVTEEGIKRLVWGPDNPLLDTTTLPGRALATLETYEHPAFRVMLDWIDRKRIAVGSLDIDRAKAKYTMSVPGAAVQLGVHETTVRTAIRSGRLSAWHRGGAYYLDPVSVSGYQVSIRGAKAVPHVSKRVAEVPNEKAPLMLRYGTDGEYELRVKWPKPLANRNRIHGDVWEAEIPQGWRHVAVLTGNKAKRTYRLYVLVPRAFNDPYDMQNLSFVGFHVRGQFEVEGKPITNPRKATEAWEAFQAE